MESQLYKIKCVKEQTQNVQEELPNYKQAFVLYIVHFLSLMKLLDFSLKSHYYLPLLMCTLYTYIINQVQSYFQGQSQIPLTLTGSRLYS